MGMLVAYAFIEAVKKSADPIGIPLLFAFFIVIGWWAMKYS